MRFSQAQLFLSLVAVLLAGGGGVDGFGHPSETADPSRGDAIEIDPEIEEEVASSHENPDHVAYDFDVHLPDHKKRVLGINLSTDLHVLSFEVAKGSYPWIHTVGGVREGDRVVFIDGKDFTKKDLKQAERALRRAKVLTIRPREGRAREASEQFRPKKLEELHVETNEGHMDVMRGHLVLFSVPVMIADFSGPPDACNPKRLAWSDPENGCMVRDDVDYDGYAGAYVVARRGGCSFSVKGAVAEEIGAAGLIIVNGDDRRVEMPIDPTLLSHSLSIPVVMVAKSDGASMQRSRSLEMGSVSARMAITSECLKGDAAWHKKYDEEYIQELEDLKEQQRQNLEKNRASVNSRGERTKEHFDSDGEQAGVEEVQASKFQTKRDRLSTKEVEEERLRMKVDSGELTLMDAGGVDLWSLEYETLNVGGYLPLSDPMRLLVLRPDSLESCHTPTPVALHNSNRDRTESNKMVPLAVMFSADVDCSHIDAVEVAHKMRADVVLLYGEADGGEEPRPYDVDVPPSGASVLMELERSDSTVLREFKGAVVCVSFNGGRAAAKENKASVSFISDPFVRIGWADIRRLTDPASWPKDERQRQRLYKKMKKVHNEVRWPERARVVEESFEEAEKVWGEWARMHEDTLREEL